MRNINKHTILYLLAIALPVIIGFRSLIFGNTTAAGDAPFFWNTGLKELFSEPLVWTNRDVSFGGVNNFLWISPLMVFYGALNKIFALDSHAINKIVFYFPAIFFAAISPFFLARFLKLSKQASLFASIFYIFNTYFLLLIDGGQVGIALAYGIFPLAVLATLAYVQRQSWETFTYSIVSLLLLSLADPRVALLALLTVLTLNFRRASFRAIFPLVVAIFLVNLYWIIPLFFIPGAGINSQLDLQLLSVLNGIFVFQPHWSGNIFGKVNPPAFYFVGLPLLFLYAVWKGKNKKVLTFFAVFLVFVFLLKGDAYPLGQIYSFLTTSIPFGNSFRDSSKFFIPLLLVGALLLSHAIENIKFRAAKIGIYAYLLFLVFPLFSGSLNFVLSNKKVNSDFETIAMNVENDSASFLRSSWFTHKHPLAFHTSTKQSIDASSLADLRPLAVKNVGDSNRFNFLDNPESIPWLRILGIKYFILSGNPRVPSLSEEEQQDWQRLTDSINQSNAFESKQWGTTVPIYQLSDTKDHLLAAPKAYLLVGSDEQVSPTAPFIYVEDGKFDPKDFYNISTKSAELVFNNKSENDFAMSFFSDYFVGTEKSNHQWGYYAPDNYLKWKYELLIRDIDTKEFDYGKGIAFSTQKNEKMSFTFDVTDSSNYVLAIRALSAKSSNNLQIKVNNELKNEIASTNNNFVWYTKELATNSKNATIEIINDGGVWVVNTVAFIPKAIWDQRQKEAKAFLDRFPPKQLQNILPQLKNDTWQPLLYERKTDVSYKVTADKNISWIFFSDSYHPNWKLRRGIDYFDSYATFSSFNGFYIEPTWGDTEVVFQGQKSFRWGVYFSSLVVLGGIVLLLLKFKRYA